MAGNIRSSSPIDGLAEPFVYLPLAQGDAVGSVDMTIQMAIVARRRGEVSLAAAMATIGQDIDQRLVLARTESLADAIELGLAPQRILATISGAMGFVALFLASMGIRARARLGARCTPGAVEQRFEGLQLAIEQRRAQVRDAIVVCIQRGDAREME